MMVRYGILAIITPMFMADETVLMVFDNEGDVKLSSSWSKADGNCAQESYGASFHHNSGVQDGEHFAEWHFEVPVDGCYAVEEHHPVSGSCGLELTKHLPVQIDYCKGQHTVGFLDLTQRGNQWNRLITLPFYVHHEAAIRISAKDLGMPASALSGTWAADAFRLQWIAKSCHDLSSEKEVAQEGQDELETEAEQEEAELSVVEPQSLQASAAKSNRIALLQATVQEPEAVDAGWHADPVEACPATAKGHFLHDGQVKSRRASARFNFDPPNDGCYVIEQRHPKLESCKASPEVPVQIDYCLGRTAMGFVDQTVHSADWSYVAALPFFAGTQGSVTLSNEGTHPGTLVSFDTVRFTWVGRSCHRLGMAPHKLELRLTTDFAGVENRIGEFAQALRTELAGAAKIPEERLRVARVRPGSVIAEILVMPQGIHATVDDQSNADIAQEFQDVMQRVQQAMVAQQQTLCQLAGAGDDCRTEVRDLGRAQPAAYPVPTEKQAKQRNRAEEKAPDRDGLLGKGFAPFALLAIAVFGFVIGIAVVLWRKVQEKCLKRPVSDTSSGSVAVVVKAVGVPVENDVMSPEDKDKVVEDDNASTVTPVSLGTLRSFCEDDALEAGLPENSEKKEDPIAPSTVTAPCRPPSRESRPPSAHSTGSRTSL